ncbi:hypothetical protein [Pseudoruminococcus massiliensis]|uniref:hypothetical protein n=1 Tax=Pseudoruminococcus massiliensis TaxID=2086583 RepID=UPI003AB64720
MINPIVIIILSAYILSFLVLRIVVKPKKPIFTGALLVMLILFVIVTSMIDTSIYGSELMSDFEKSMVSFVTSTRIQDTVKLESSFRIFAWIDIGLFAVTIISMYVEFRAILISVYSERGKAKNQEIENLTEQTNKSMKGI